MLDLTITRKWKFLPEFISIYNLKVHFNSFYAEGVCWTRTAERQTSRMRIKYLKSVLRQEVGFFDSQTADSSITYQVVSTLSSDANTIQAVIGEKVSVLP